MAQIALVGAASGAGAGPAGLAVAAVMGAVIDSYWMPYVFKRNPIEAGKVGDLQLLGTEEGTPIFIAVGDKVKVPGRLIWRDEVFPVSAQGSAGKHQSVINWKYYYSAAIQFLRVPVNNFLKIWADGEVVFDEDTPAKDETKTYFTLLPIDNSPYAWVRAPIEEIDEVDFRDWQYGPPYPVTMSGWSNGANNGTFACIGKGSYTNGLTGNVFTYLVLTRTSGSWVIQGAGASVRVKQPQPSWISGFQYQGKPTFFKGGNSQPVSTVMEDALGVGLVPAYRGNAMLVTKRMDTTKYGARIPNIEGLLEVLDTPTLDLAINKLFDLAGLPHATYADTSILSSIALKGYPIQGPQELARTLQPLLMLFDLGARERDGKMVFFRRLEPDIVALSAASLGAFDGEGDPPQSLEIQNQAPTDIPGRILVSHINPDNDYAQGEQAAAISNSKDSPTLQVSLPIVVDADECRTMAFRLLAQLQGDNKLARISLPPSYLYIEPGDLLQVTVEGHSWELEVLEKTRGANWVYQYTVLIRTARDFAWQLKAS